MSNYQTIDICESPAPQKCPKENELYNSAQLGRNQTVGRLDCLDFLGAWTALKKEVL